MDIGIYETDIIGLRMLAGYDRPRAAKLCHVTERTFKRWENHSRAPGSVVELLRLLTGDLGPLGWPGWRLSSDGLLYPPERVQGESPNDVSGLWWLRQFLDNTRNELRAARREIAVLERRNWVLHARLRAHPNVVIFCSTPPLHRA